MIKDNAQDILFFIAAIFVYWLLIETGNASTDGALYKTRCISCHNANPSKPGAIGPDIADSSLELITLKTQKREYPKNYKPKRKTRIMPRIILSENQLKDIYNYIAKFKKKK
jgi:mono/diheme cytochrome c family protein